MFKAVRIFILLVLLIFVAASTWLTQARSTDWNDSLWVKIYPINADNSEHSRRYIESLELADFASIESFIARETSKYGRSVQRPVRMELGLPVSGQPPALGPSPGIPQVMLWSLRLRWWAKRSTREQDRLRPDVRIFVRYHTPQEEILLEDSVGMQKGMVGVVNAFASRRHAPMNNVIIAHEFLHTLGATDKYDLGSGLPIFPAGYAEPQREPLLPQRYAEIMAGRIAISENDAMIPASLRHVMIGLETAQEIRLAR